MRDDYGTIDAAIIQAIVTETRKRKMTLDDPTAIESLAREFSGRYRQKVTTELVRRVMHANPE